MGSEMFIRDRTHVTPVVHEELITPARTKGLIYRDEGCLLYTSDAADERSSVDLGGPRFLKKKKRRKIP